MMNNKNSPIGIFRQNITNPEHLAKTTIGRQHLLDDLLGKLQRRTKKRSGQNHLFIGPRGIGKSHLLTLLQQKIEKNQLLRKSYSVVRFPEESNRILSFADLLLGITELLAETEDNQELSSLHQELETQEDDKIIIDRILPRLKSWHKKTDKIILILLENIDVILTEQIKDSRDIHQIRSMLMDNSHIVLIGTAPTFFSALNNVSSPLFDFFDIQLLEELTQEQTLELIKSHLEWNKHEELLKNFTELKSRLLAMYDLTGGNPRLIMMLYELITKDNIQDIKIKFQKLLDQVTPFYQDRLKDLAPQERALLETIAVMREQKRTPANIAKIFRKSRKQTSVLLKRMTKSGYLSVSPNPDDKRSRLYRIKEGFFDIWLAMNKSRGNRKRLPFLVDFFRRFYLDKEQRERKRLELNENLKKIKDEAKENTLKNLDYLSEASTDSNEKQIAKMDLVVKNLEQNKSDEAKNLLNEVNAINSKIQPNTMGWIHEKINNWSNTDKPEDILKYFEKIISYWQEQHSGDLEKTAELFNNLDLDFSSHGLHELHIALLEDKLMQVTQESEKVPLLLKIANSQRMDGQLNPALKTLKTTLAIVEKIGDKSAEGTVLNYISQIYHDKGDYKTALDFLEQSLIIHQEIGYKAGEGATLNNISAIYHVRGDYKTELKYLKQSLKISLKIGDKLGEGSTLNNISQIYHDKGDYKMALKYLKQSLKICQEIGDKAGEGATLNNISQIYDAKGDYKTALNYLEQSLKISQEIGAKAGVCRALYNMGHIFLKNKEHKKAMKTWVEVYLIAREIDLAQILDALERLAKDLGLENGLESWEKLAQDEDK